MKKPRLDDRTADSPATWRALLRSGHFGQYMLLCLGILLHGCDALVTATIMPAAVADIGGVVYINWTIALYQIGSIITGAAGGALARRHGLRPLFVAGALFYAAGCFIAAMAPTMAAMLMGRMAQGIGGGLMLALSYLAVQLLFPRSLWTKLYALSSAIWSITALGGPLIGGLFADAGFWRGAFWAFGAPALALAAVAGAFLRAPTPSANVAGQCHVVGVSGPPHRRRICRRRSWRPVAAARLAPPRYRRSDAAARVRACRSTRADTAFSRIRCWTCERRSARGFSWCLRCRPGPRLFGHMGLSC